MTGGQIAALIFALLLLLPGGCFLFFGFGLMGESHMGDTAAMMREVMSVYEPTAF